MEISVGFVLELAREKPPVLLRELHRHLHHSGCAQCRRCENHLRTQETHQPSPLDAERFGHRNDQRISLRSTDHREPDAGVATRRLDYSLPGLECTASLCILDHAERKTVFHGAERIERFDLYVEVDPGWSELVDSDNRSVADCLENG